MEEMLKYVKQYQQKHRTETIDNVTSYMFQATSNPQKDEKPKTVIYMASWFLQI